MAQGFAKPETVVTVTGGGGGGGTGTDDDAIHDNVAAEISAVTEKVSPVSADLLLIEDSAAGNIKKRVQVGNLPTGSDAAAIHDDVAAEISAITEKVAPVGADKIIIEDSAAGHAKKMVQITNLPTGSDAAAIHDNVSAEISAITEKTTPISGDLILIEDSAAANVKKRVQVGNLPVPTVTVDVVTTNSTVSDGIISLEAAVTATMHTAQSTGDMHLVKRKLTTGTPTLAAGGANAFWRDGVTATSYDFETNGAQVAFYWDGSHWMVTGISGVVT